MGSARFLQIVPGLCDVCPCEGCGYVITIAVRRDYMPAFNRDLRVWRSSMEFTVSVYAATQFFPKQELYGLVSQMHRAAVSNPRNIAEGKVRLTDRDRAHFFAQPTGSLLELETQSLIAAKLD